MLLSKLPLTALPNLLPVLAKTGANCLNAEETRGYIKILQTQSDFIFNWLP